MITPDSDHTLSKSLGIRTIDPPPQRYHMEFDVYARSVWRFVGVTILALLILAGAAYTIVVGLALAIESSL